MFSLSEHIIICFIRKKRMKIIVRKNGRLINTLQESCVFSTWNKECTEWQATSISLSHSVAKSEENIWSFKTGHDITSSVFFYTEMNRCSNEKCIFFFNGRTNFSPNFISVCLLFGLQPRWDGLLNSPNNIVFSNKEQKCCLL